jgi:hypothetical protein
MAPTARLIWAGAGLALLALQAFPVRAAPVDNIGDFFTELRSCVIVNAPPALAGSKVSIRFSITNKGALIGKPGISYIRFSGNSAAKGKFTLGVLTAVKGCFPIQITQEMGNNVAGQVWNFELSADPQQNWQETVD